MTFETKTKEIQKIDEKDKKIITYLHDNLETSKKHLAKECNISPQSLNYKIQRLEELNILTPLCLFNFRPLGFKHYNILISKISSNQLDELQKCDEISVLIEVFGQKRYIVEVMSQNIELFIEKYLKYCEFELIKLNKDYINTQNIFNIKINQKLILKQNFTNNSESKEFFLNNENSSMILELSNNPKHSILSLSQTTELHRQTVQKYLKVLQEKLILHKRIFAINAFSLGFQEFILQISFQQQEKKELIKLLEQEKYISLFSTSFQEIICYMTVPNFNEFSKSIQKLESELTTTSINYFEILNILKIENIAKSIRKSLK